MKVYQVCLSSNLVVAVFFSFFIQNLLVPQSRLWKFAPFRHTKLQPVTEEPPRECYLRDRSPPPLAYPQGYS